MISPTVLFLRCLSLPKIHSRSCTSKTSFVEVVYNSVVGNMERNWLIVWSCPLNKQYISFTKH